MATSVASLARYGHRALSLWLALVCLGVLASCKRGTYGSPPPEACAAYSTKLCEAAGTGSAVCLAIRTATQAMSPKACAAGLDDLGASWARLADLRRPCDEVIARVCDAVGPQSPGCEMARAQTPQFPPERCREMSEHLPDVVAELRAVVSAREELPTSATR